MRRLNFPLIADTFLAASCAFLLFFTLIRYYTKNAVYGLIFAIFAFLAFGALAYLYISRKQDRKLLLARDEKQKSLLSLHLSLCTHAEIVKLFSAALDDTVQDGKTLTDGERVYFFDFCLKQLSPDDIAEVIKWDSDKSKVLYCNSVSGEASDLAADFNISVVGATQTFNLLKQKNLLPEQYKFGGKQKPNVFQRVRSRLTRKRSLQLFRCGLVLILFSFFTFFPVYYIVSGSILLALAAVCLVFGKRE